MQFTKHKHKQSNLLFVNPCTVKVLPIYLILITKYEYEKF